jgi:hypothetical protein
MYWSVFSTKFEKVAEINAYGICYVIDTHCYIICLDQDQSLFICKFLPHSLHL